MPIAHDYIRATLERFEGKGLTKGYVPSKNGVPLGVSGVTIGTGVDLGQQTADRLLHMGVPPAVVDKFTPYLGLKKTDAQAALRALPLILSPAEVESLDQAVISRYTRDIAARYDRDAPAATFSSLPKEAQAVLVSILFQRGLAYPAKAPQLWRALLAGHWQAAATWLQSPANGGGYHSRRKAEGEMLTELGGASGGQREGAALPLDSLPRRGAAPFETRIGEDGVWWEKHCGRM